MKDAQVWAYKVMSSSVCVDITVCVTRCDAMRWSVYASRDV